MCPLYRVMALVAAIAPWRNRRRLNGNEGREFIPSLIDNVQRQVVEAMLEAGVVAEVG